MAQSLRGGGVERAMLRMARGWIESGARVTLVLGDAQGPLAAELPPGIDVVGLNDIRYSALAAVAGIVRDRRPDILFCPGNHYGGAAALARLRLGAACPPVVAKISNALVRPEQSPLAAFAYRRWLRMHPRFVDHIVAMTPAMADEAAAEMAMPRDRISVIPNPPAMPIAGAAPVALPPGRFILGVGRLEPQKRWDRLIAALPRIADRDVSLLILGEGTLRAQLTEQIAALGLTGRVALPGHAADPLPAIARAAVVALTSDYEGVPGVLREALGLGTPVVATESSVAVREIVSAPELGSIVARDDPEALVAALDHWLTPGRPRPAPVVPQGGDPIAAYLDLFETLADQRRR